VELGRSVKHKPKTPNFSIVINKKPSNSTTMLSPAAPASLEPKWTLEGPSNSYQVETDTEEEEWMKVNPGPSQEEMVRQIRATDKRKMQYDQMQELSGKYHQNIFIVYLVEFSGFRAYYCVSTWCPSF